MAKKTEVKKAKRAGKPDSPFGKPSADEVFDILIPEGAETGKIPASDQYIGKLLSLTKETSKTSGNPMWTWVFTIAEGDYAGLDFTMWTPLTPNALWKLADTLTALGIDWKPGEPVSFKLAEVLGTLVRLVIKDDKLPDSGREVSKLAAVLPHPKGAGTKGKKGFIVPGKAEDDEDEDEDEEFPSAKRGRASRDEEDDEEEEAPRRRGRAAADEDEDEEDEEEEAPRRRRGARDEEEDDEEEEERPRRRRSKSDDEDEEDEVPTRKSRKAASADEEDDEDDTPRRKRKARDDEDEEDDEDEPAPRKRKAVYDEDEEDAPRRRRGPKVEERPVRKARR